MTGSVSGLIRHSQNKASNELMNLNALIKRGTELLINPASEFEHISKDIPARRTLLRSYMIPLAIVIAITSFIENIVSGLSDPLNNFLFISLNTIIVFLLVLTHLYVSGIAITALGKNIVPETGKGGYFALSSYSQLPFLIILAVVKLFPSLLFLLVLGLYSGLLFYSGSVKLSNIEPGRRLQFTLLSILIMLVSFIIFSELFTLFYSKIIELFTTFAANGST